MYIDCSCYLFHKLVLVFIFGEVIRVVCALHGGQNGFPDVGESISVKAPLGTRLKSHSSVRTHFQVTAFFHQVAQATKYASLKENIYFLNLLKMIIISMKLS